jgi:hypothetical protein
MEASVGKRLPSWGPDEIEAMIERCTRLQELNTRKHDPIHPDLATHLKEFKESLEDSQLELEERHTHLWIGYEEFSTTLHQVEDFLRKNQASPRPEQGSWKRRRSSHSEDKQKTIADLRRLNDKLHSHSRKLKRYISLIKRQVEEENHNQLLSLLTAPASTSVTDFYRVQTAMSDYAAPAFHRRETFDVKSILTSITLLKSSVDGDDEMDREIRDELEQRTENWLKRMHKPDHPPSPETIISEFIDPDEELNPVNEPEDEWRPLPPLPNRTITGFHSTTTSPDTIFGSELFETNSSIISLPKGIRLATIEGCLV